MDTPGRAQLVFVHGIGGVRDAVAEKRAWLEALAEGARHAGHAAAVSGLTQGWLAETHFANYSDLFARDGEQGASGHFHGEQLAFLDTLVCELTDELLLQAQEQGDRRALRVIEDTRGCTDADHSTPASRTAAGWPMGQWMASAGQPGPSRAVSGPKGTRPSGSATGRPDSGTSAELRGAGASSGRRGALTRVCSRL